MWTPSPRCLPHQWQLTTLTSLTAAATKKKKEEAEDVAPASLNMPSLNPTNEAPDVAHENKT